MEVPFLNYHTSLLISKLRNGDDIYAHDINQAIYGSAVNRLVEPYFAYNAKRTVVYRGYKADIRRNNAYLRKVRMHTYGNATFKARRGRFAKYSRRKHFRSNRYFGKRYRKSF